MMALLIWSMFGGGDGNAGGGKQYVVCVLRMWQDEGAAMEYVVFFCEKEDGRGEGAEEKGDEKEKEKEKEEDNCSIREDSIAGMDYVVCVCRIWEDGCVGMEYVVSS